MRIGLFTDTYPPYINGVSTSVQMLKNALEAKGHSVYVVTINPENMKYEFDDNVIKIPGIPIGIYDYRLSGVYPLRAINIIRKWKLDVIHSHTEYGVGTFARVLSRQLNIPLVHTYHTLLEDYVHYITKGYFNRSSKKIAKYLSLFYGDKTANELIVPTNKIYSLFKEKYKVDRNIHIVPTGIEVARFFEENVNMNDVAKLKKKLGLNNNDFVLLYVGRIAEEKNIPYLIETMRDLVRRKSSIKFVIVGDGPDYENYVNLAKKYKLQDNIIFTGRVEWSSVPLYYQMADLFLTASTSETQGLTVVEAMAAATVPVVIRDESFVNTVVHDLNGKIFRTKRQLKDAVYELIDDEDKLLKMKKQARISSEMYSSELYAERVLKVYDIAIRNSENSYGPIGKIVKKIKGNKK